MWYLALGLLLLVASLWLPFATARRAMRVEARANDVARALMEAVGDTVDALDANDVDTVLARFFGLAARDGIYVEDLERVDPAWPGTLLSLRNKHYLFQLAESPPDPKESPGAETVPAYEVMAWPRRALGPANSVFFHPDNAVPAYTRNLAQGYADIARIGAILDYERARSRRVLHLDSGDSFQGALVFNEYSGEAEMRLLTEIGLDAAVADTTVTRG